MVQGVLKWKVEVTDRQGNVTSIWINDNYLANVLRTLAAIDFTEHALTQPDIMVIRFVPPANPQTGTFVGGGGGIGSSGIPPGLHSA